MAFVGNPLNFPQLTAKSAPIPADLLLMADSAASNALKQATLATLVQGGANLPVNTQNTNYNLVASDRGKIIFSNQATLSTAGFLYTLLAPATAGTGWYCYFENQNLSSFGLNTIFPASGTINGKSSYILTPGNSCLVYTDGSNYYIIGTPKQWGRYINFVDIVAALPGWLSTTLSNTLTQTQGVLLNSNVVTIPFYVSNNVAIANVIISVSVGLAASTVTVGIYNDNTANAQPTGAALGAVSIATASPGQKTGTFGTAIQLYANNMYWAAIQTSSAVTLSLGNVAVNVDTTSVVNTYQTGVMLPTLANAYSAGTLPTWSGSVSSNQSFIPWIILSPS